jgi:hypothetical protein
VEVEVHERPPGDGGRGTGFLLSGAGLGGK